MGRTGRFSRWNTGTSNRHVLLAKALSAAMFRSALLTARTSSTNFIKWIAPLCMVTFAKNDLAMAAGIERSRCSSRKTGRGGRQARRRASVALTRMVPLECSRSSRQGLMIALSSPAKIAAAQGVVECARNRQQGSVLPAHHGAAVQGPKILTRSPARSHTSSCCRR